MQEQYQVINNSDSEWYVINGLKIHIRRWSNSGKPKLLLLHGWMDVSASFQFMVDCLPDKWDIYAMDWRGMGLSEHQLNGYYDRAMMLSDLSQLIDMISPNEPIHVLGHSLGGMLLSFYAGIMPDRLKSVIIVEGFGLPDNSEEQQVKRVNSFFKTLLKSAKFLAITIKSRESFVANLMAKNPYFPGDKANFISYYLLKEQDGKLLHTADYKHRINQPFSYNSNHYQMFWQQIKSPLLWVQGGFLPHNEYLNSIRQSLDKRYELMGKPTKKIIKNSGHMIHWEAPQQLANTVNQFIQSVENE